MNKYPQLSADELAMLQEQFRFRDESDDAASSPVTLALPGGCLASSEALYLVRETDRFEFRYPLLIGMDRHLTTDIPLILEKGNHKRDLRVSLPGSVAGHNNAGAYPLADISMSGFLVFSNHSGEILSWARIVLSSEQGEVVLEADVKAVRQASVWQKRATAYQFLSLRQGEDSLRQLIYDCHRRLAQG